jgi:putative two-component system response regulator
MEDVPDHVPLLQAEVDVETAGLREGLKREKRIRGEIASSHIDTIKRLAAAAEFKDEGTGGHVERIGDICTILAEKLGMSPEELELVGPATSLHDIGKIGIPDLILLKPASLTMEERAIMEKHTHIGSRILESASAPILRLGSTVALTHHERWDGTGYPHGLSGEEIPLVARICAVADAFDAITSHRPYRSAFSRDYAYDHIRRVRGKEFDPDVVDAFFSVLPRIEAIKDESREILRPFPNGWTQGITPGTGAVGSRLR